VEWFDAHLAELVGLLRPDCVLDVGANAGQFGERLRAVGYDGWIVSFEPVPGPYSELERRARADGRWRTHRVALGEEDGRARLGVTRQDVFSSMLELTEYGRERFPGQAEVVAEEEVELRRLDSFWDECLAGVPHERPFLKLDTQGSDLSVVRGAGAVLDRVVGMQVELSFKPLYEGAPGWLETLASLSEHGFEPTAFFAVERDRLLRLIEADCLLVSAPS
jgi:FkbM family methyltransferase